MPPPPPSLSEKIERICPPPPTPPAPIPFPKCPPRRGGAALQLISRGQRSWRNPRPDLFRAQQYFLGLVLIRASCLLLSHPSGPSPREAAGPCRGYQAFACVVMASLHPGHFAEQKTGCVFILELFRSCFPLPCRSFKRKSVLFVRAGRCGAGGAAEGCSARSAAWRGSPAGMGAIPKRRHPKSLSFPPFLFTTHEPSGSSDSPGGPGCGGARPGSSRAAGLQG